MRERTTEKVAILINDAGRDIEAKAELWKLEAVDKATDIASSLLSRILLFIIILIGVVAFNTGIALLIGRWLGEAYYGFFIVAGFYLLLGLILYLARNSLIKAPFYNAVINKLLK